jgi:hypothetical protein
MANLTITLTGANGDTITFDDINYILTDGLKGFGIPATTLRIQPSAVDGGVFRHTKRGIREVDLPVVTIGSSREDTEAKLRRLGNALNNYNGAAVLTATYPDGSAFYLTVYYAGGGETVFGQQAGSTYAQWVISLQAANPFWTSATAQTFKVTQSGTGRGLLPKLANLKLTSTAAIGTVIINNAIGDVPSYPVWKAYGPMDSLTINNGSVGFVYNSPITAGDVVTIDTYAGTVTNLAGTNVYSNLSSAPKFFTIPPGTSTANIYGANVTSATQISCTYYPRREVLH